MHKVSEADITENMVRSNPLISIITINLNNGSGIERTIKSVSTQSYDSIEYIVIDGGSTDESVAVIEENIAHIQYYVSEKDTGLYNAMNKGVTRATGAYLLFLNSGDHFFSNDSLATLISGAKGEDLIYGDLSIVEVNRTFIKTYPNKLSFSHFLESSLPHPCTLIKASVFQQVGLYNEKLKIVSDWLLFILAVCKFNVTYLHVNTVISTFYADGISSKIENIAQLKKEANQMLHTHFGTFLEDYNELANVKNQLENLRNSKLHSMATNMKRSGMYRFLKKVVKG
jgi:glycosyltransferase involved in cell wall biosynthesis